MSQPKRPRLEPTRVSHFSKFTSACPFLAVCDIAALCHVSRRAQTEVQSLLKEQREQLARIWMSGTELLLPWMSERYIDPVSLEFRNDLWDATRVHDQKEFMIKALFSSGTGIVAYMPKDLLQLAKQVLIPIFQTRSCLSIPSVLTAYHEGTKLAQDLMTQQFLRTTGVEMEVAELKWVLFGGTSKREWQVDKLRLVQSVLHEYQDQFFHRKLLQEAQQRVHNLLKVIESERKENKTKT